MEDAITAHPDCGQITVPAIMPPLSSIPTAVGSKRIADNPHLDGVKK
jgi:hypothetical protein